MNCGLLRVFPVGFRVDLAIGPASDRVFGGVNTRKWRVFVKSVPVVTVTVRPADTS